MGFPEFIYDLYAIDNISFNRPKTYKSIVNNGYYVLLVRNIKQKDESFNERDDPLKLLSVIDNSSFQNLSSSK